MYKYEYEAFLKINYRQFRRSCQWSTYLDFPCQSSTSQPPCQHVTGF